MINIFSFFSGLGLLDLGFEVEEEYKVTFVNEIEEKFMDAYKHSRRVLEHEAPEYGYHNCSIEEFLNGEKYTYLQDKINQSRNGDNIVGFIGGPPCPDFSVGGKNQGKDGENGKLSLSYINVIKAHQPDFFIFENVKGLIRTKKHQKFYAELKETLRAENYVLCDRMLNSLEFGVPQDRERIILFGIKKEMVGNADNIQLNWEDVLKFNDVKNNVKNWPQKDTFIEDRVMEMPQELLDYSELTVEHWFRKNDVMNHCNSSLHFNPKSSKFTVIEEGDDSKKSFKRLHRWRYSPTAAYGNNEVHLHPYKARRLSVAEVLAIQSMPKEFQLPNDITLSAAFKTLGNGVPFLMAKGIAKVVKQFLGENL